MIRSFKLRLRPTKAQVVTFDEILRDSQETYNAALQERIEAWRLQRKSVTLYEQFGELTQLRADPQFAHIAVDIQREPLRRLDKAFNAFFRRCKWGEKPGFPRFRSRDRYTSFAFSAKKIGNSYVNVPSLGHVKFKAHRQPVGDVRQITIKRNGNKWEARVACDIGEAPGKVSISNAVGIDVGISTLVHLSDGIQIENPRWTRKHERQIAKANRRLALKQLRSKNRLRAREVLRRAHQRAADARCSYLHHVSKWLIQNYDLIAYEDLKIRNMVRSNLAKSIMDAAWGELIRQIIYKAEEAGKWVIPVNPRSTSIRCSGCGEPVPKTLADRQHNCACGVSLDRDHNAALNILALGMSAAGPKGPSECVLT